ncbi:hypothetical protein [Microcystis phage Mae-JY35]
MTDFGRDARDLPASDDARRSGEWVAGPFETPAVILDWHYARSPFAMELARERLGLLGTAAPSSGEREDFSPRIALPFPAPVHRLEADNQNSRLWLVR